MESVASASPVGSTDTIVPVPSAEGDIGPEALPIVSTRGGAVSLSRLLRVSGVSMIGTGVKVETSSKVSSTSSISKSAMGRSGISKEPGEMLAGGSGVDRGGGVVILGSTNETTVSTSMIRDGVAIVEQGEM